MNTFALVGAAGYIAPRHMKAIKSVGGDLKVAFDPSDSVGVLDSYFPDARFFVEFERYDRYLDKLRRQNKKIDYVSICSPNYLHDAQCRHALRCGADAICEKPLVLNPWNVDALAEIERETGNKVFTILQLRLHPSVKALKNRIAQQDKSEFAIDLTYITSRGPWYQTSWKGDDAKAGGIATNIGIHFFDLLTYVFGQVEQSVAHLRTPERAAGFIKCRRASIRWFLSVSREDLPLQVQGTRSTYRSITIDHEEFEFSEGFADLHTSSYEEILTGRGFGLDVVRPSVELVSAFRSSRLDDRAGERHPLTSRYLA